MPVLEGLAAAPVADDEKLEIVSGKSRERDDTQRALDADFGTLVSSWKGMSKTPETVPVEKRPRKRYLVGPKDKSALKAAIRRAATLHQAEALFFKDGKNDKGMAVITFTMGPPKPKTH